MVSARGKDTVFAQGYRLEKVFSAIKAVQWDKASLTSQPWTLSIFLEVLIYSMPLWFGVIMNVGFYE